MNMYLHSQINHSTYIKHAACLKVGRVKYNASLNVQLEHAPVNYTLWQISVITALVQ